MRRLLGVFNLHVLSPDELDVEVRLARKIILGELPGWSERVHLRQMTGELDEYL